MARGLGDRTRLALLVALADGEQTVGQLVERLELPQPKVSNHLAALRACGLVRSRREHRTVINELADARVAALAGAVAALVPPALPERLEPRDPNAPVELDAAALRLAPRLEPARAEARELVVFVLGGGDYALPIAAVREIVGYVRPRPLPGAAPRVLGIVQVHGRLLESVDVRARLGLAEGPAFAQLVVVEDEGRAVAMPVEAVREVVTVPPAGLLPPPVASAELDVVAAVEDRLVLVLRASAIVAAA